MSRAEYMREYRAKQRRAVLESLVAGPMMNDALRILELEEEVRHLKAELAKRPIDVTAVLHMDSSVADEMAKQRRTAQAQRDAILNRVNRGNKP